MRHLFVVKTVDTQDSINNSQLRALGREISAIVGERSIHIATAAQPGSESVARILRGSLGLLFAEKLDYLAKRNGHHGTYEGDKEKLRALVEELGRNPDSLIVVPSYEVAHEIIDSYRSSRLEGSGRLRVPSDEDGHIAIHLNLKERTYTRLPRTW